MEVPFPPHPHRHLFLIFLRMATLTGVRYFTEFGLGFPVASSCEHLSMCRWVICLPAVRITFVLCAFLPPTIRNVVESEYLSKLKKLVSHTFRKLMLYFLGSSASSAAVLESDKPGELPTDMPAGGGETGDHGHAGGPVWHCWGHPGGQCGHPF